VAECGEGDLGSVEELAGALLGDDVDEDAVGGAGDEVAHALVTDKHGHGVAVGFGGRAGCPDFVVVFGNVRVKGALPCCAAAAEGGFGVGGFAGGAGGVGGREVFKGLVDDVLFEGSFGHEGFS